MICYVPSAGLASAISLPLCAGMKSFRLALSCSLRDGAEESTREPRDRKSVRSIADSS